MVPFGCDYNFGAHPAVLSRLSELNNTPFKGYGEDELCKEAGEKIKKAFDCPDAQVYFLAGGTQTNQLVIDTVLMPYEGVIAAVTGHVAAHEAGAIEFTGHKVISLPGTEGKLSAQTVENFLNAFYADENHEHMVYPGMVYISFPTEYGTLYSKEELTSLSEVCRAHRIPLYIDGARLGYGLVSAVNDVTPAEFASLADIFYVGGTKVGALYGEAVVFTHNRMPIRFNTRVKQHGAMLAKGWLLGAQFDTLFTDDLYFKISRNAEEKAQELEEILTRKGYRFFMKRQSNQLFVVVENEKLKALSADLGYGYWEEYDQNHTVIRLATGWATTAEMLREAEKIL